MTRLSRSLRRMQAQADVEVSRYATVHQLRPQVQQHSVACADDHEIADLAYQIWDGDGRPDSSPDPTQDRLYKALHARAIYLGEADPDDIDYEPGEGL